jgi:SAM-dependent methyltransferase
VARIEYNAQMAAVYDRGRALEIDGLAAWRDALARYLPGSSGLPVLDLGSGTGIFAFTMAQWFALDVLAVEPSAAMRGEASRARSHPHVRHIEGDAENLPLGAQCCEAAWLSTVIHHISDLGRCAHELRRVLRPDSPVLIRSAFPGRLDDITLFRFFPEGRAVAETFPSVEKTIEAFAAAGFAFERLESVPQVTAMGLKEVEERVRLRADTTLASISDRAFDAGLEALARAAAAEAVSLPVVDRLDLLVLR